MHLEWSLHAGKRKEVLMRGLDDIYGPLTDYRGYFCFCSGPVDLQRKQRTHNWPRCWHVWRGRSALEGLEEGNKVSFGAVRNFAGCFCSRPVCSIVCKVLFVCICRLCVPCRAVLCARRERKWKETKRPIDRASEHRRSFDLDREYTLNLLSGFIVTGAAFRNAIAIVSVSFVRASEWTNERGKETN